MTDKFVTAGVVAKQKIPLLDACRLIAALIVVMVHYEIIFGHFVVYGALGTTALSWFFVLSGFILSYTYPTLDTAAHFKRFYTHRVIRIYPVYFMAVVTSTLFVTVNYLNMGEAFFAEVHRPFEIMYDLPQAKPESFWWLAGLRHLTFTQSISSLETLNLVFNGPLWSLVLEVYFYLCFPLLLFLLKSVDTKLKIAAAFVCAYVLQFALIQLFLPDVEQYDVMNLNTTVYTNPAIRGIEFVVGMLLFKAYRLRPQGGRHDAFRLTPVVMTTIVYLAVVWFSENYVPYQYSRFFVALPVVTYLVYALATMNWHPASKAEKLCVTFGGISYVLYCFHWPLMEMIQFVDLLPESFPFPVHLLMLTILLLLFSWMFYRYIETPIRKAMYRYTESARG